MDKLIEAFLLDDQNRSRVIENGVVVSIATPTRIPQMFDGWQDILIAWERNRSSHAQIRNFSLPIGLFMLTNKLVSNDFYTYNIDRRLFLLLKYFVSEIDAMDAGAKFRDYYKYLHKLELDLASVVDKQSEGRLEINGKEGGLFNLIKANENTEYSIPFDADAIKIHMVGIELHKTVTQGVPADVEVGSDVFSEFAMPTFEKGVDGNAAGILTFEQQLEVVPDHFDYLANSVNYAIIEAPTFHAPITIGIKGKIVVQCTQALSSVFGELQIRLLKQDGTAFQNGDPNPIGLLPRTPLGNFVAGTLYTYEFDIEGTLQPGDKVFWLCQLFKFSEVGEVLAAKFVSSEFTYVFKSTELDSYIDAFLPGVFWRKLLLKIGATEAQIQSNLLALSGNAITSGDAIRGLSGTSITTTYAKFTKSYDMAEFAGWGVQNGKVLFEDRLQFYDKTNPRQLGSVKGLENTFDKTYTGSSIKFGWQEQEIENVNGKYDPNGYIIFLTPMKAGEPKQVDLQADYKAGPMEIEVIRINLEGKVTTDGAQDDQVYVIAVDKENPMTGTTQVATFQNLPVVGGAFNIIRLPIGVTGVFVKGQRIKITGSVNNNIETTVTAVHESGTGVTLELSDDVVNEGPIEITITFVGAVVYGLDKTQVIESGVLSPETWFNVRLRPAELFKKHYRWVRSWLNNYEPGQLIFDHANMNDAVVVAGVPDKRNILISEMGERIFIPILSEFTPEILINLQELFEVEPNKSFEFDWKGNHYGGFFENGGIGVTNKRPQVFKLLLFGDTDLKKFIK